jgi:hypothetical protein
MVFTFETIIDDVYRHQILTDESKAKLREYAKCGCLPRSNLVGLMNFFSNKDVSCK